MFFVIALIAIGTCIFLYFSYDIINAKSSNEAAYWGALVGSILVGLIALISLFVTLQSNSKNQREANKLQSSLRVEENLTQKLGKTSEQLASAFNQLEIMLLIMQYLKIEKEGNFYPERNSIIQVYSKFRTAMNGIRMNTSIYQNLSKCEGCSDCNIKTYGELAKVTMALQRRFVQIDKECTNAFSGLETALSLAMDSSNLVKNISNRMELIASTKSIISTQEQLIQVSSETKKADIQHEIIENSKNILNYENELKDLKRTLESNTDVISNCNKNAREKANHISAELKWELDNAINAYLGCYNMYIKESVSYTAKNGRVLNPKCKKFDFEE